MFLRTIAAFLTVLFAVTVANSNQADSRNKDGCALIDKTRPPQFIVYEGKSEFGIRLRLRNNSSCAIVVETDDQYPTHLKKLPQGGVAIEPVLESREGLRLRLHYLVQRPGASPKRAYGWGDSVFTYEIQAGQSIVFDIPATHLKGRSDIAVPFGYSWEGANSIGMATGGVVHRVYFLFSDLPSAAHR